MMCMFKGTQITDEEAAICFGRADMAGTVTAKCHTDTGRRVIYLQERFS